MFNDKHCTSLQIVFFLFNIIFLLAACNSKTSNSLSDTISIPVADSSIKLSVDTTFETFDTTILPFSDSSYKLIFSVFDLKSNHEKNNSTVTLSRIYNNNTRKILQDSFYCMNAIVECQDFNNDNIKDVLLFYSTGARANPTYHFYLVDTIKHNLTYIKGFEKLPNPDFDSSNNIITSAALFGGSIFWSFYRINSQNKLIDLKHSFTTDFGGDSIKYHQAIKKILKDKNINDQ